MSKPIEPVYRAFGARIDHIRTTLDLTQQEVAQRVGKNRTTVVNIEQGRQRILLADVELFADALGTTPKNLLRGIWT